MTEVPPPPPPFKSVQVETLKLVVKAEMLLANLEAHMAEVESFIEERRRADARERDLGPGDLFNG